MDNDAYSGAAIVPYRKVDGHIELLLGFEKPWNSFTQSFDPLSWSLLGGKRIRWSESSALTTARRTFLECVGETFAIASEDDIHKASGTFSMWYTVGKYAIIFLEVDGKDVLYDELPKTYSAAKGAGGPQEEFTKTSDGIKKWSKMIDSLEWVKAADLVPEPKKERSDLLQNVLKASEELSTFLDGKLDPATAFPAAKPREPPKASKEGKAGKGGKDGKSWGKGNGGKDFKAGGKKGGKGFKGDKGCGKFGGKGAGYATMYQNMVLPMAPPYGAMGLGGPDMQKQVMGEQLYAHTLPLVPNSFIAQKITGMLLELPHNELVSNLRDMSELKLRVNEALLLLKEDGVIS